MFDFLKLKRLGIATRDSPLLLRTHRAQSVPSPGSVEGIWRRNIVTIANHKGRVRSDGVFAFANVYVCCSLFL